MLLFVVLLTRSAASQDLEAGLHVGLSVYNGDLSPVVPLDYLQDLNPAFGGFLRYEMNRVVAFRLNAIVTKLTANGGNNTTTPYKVEDTEWRTPLTEASLMLEITPFRINWFKGFEIQPYAHAGAAVFNFNPQLYLDNRWVDMQPLGTEGQGLDGYAEPYKLTQVSVPAGGGVRLNFNSRFSIGAEFTGRIVFTDYLDDIGSAIVNYDDLRRGKGEQIAKFSNPNFKGGEKLTYRRGNGARDYYYSGGINLIYRLTGGPGISPMRNGKASKGRSKTLGCYRFNKKR